MKTKNIISALFATLVTSGLFAQGITIQSEIHNPTCYAYEDGSIALTVSGGTPPYNYYWSTGDNTDNAQNLQVGEYSVMVVDANGNSTSKHFLVTQPEKVNVESTINNVSTFGGKDGYIDLTVSGLTATYDVIWSTTNGSGIMQGNFDQSGLSAGVYKLDIITEGGCTNSKSFIVSQKLPRFAHPGKLNNINSSGSFGHMPLVYPNPSNGQVNFRNVEATDLIEIYNQFGTRIQAVNAMEGTNLPVGNYNVVITHADGNREVETLVVR